MARMFPNRILTSVDIGTTKICVLVGHVLDNNSIEIIGIGRSNSDGLRKGVVVDVAKTIHSIQAAVKEAELMTGLSLDDAIIGISGSHIQSINSHGVVPIKRGVIGAADIAQVLASAKAIPISEGQYILHVLPQYFVIDSRDRVHDPLHMHGIRLEVHAHIVTGAIASVQNLIKCCESIGLQVNDVVLEQLASAAAVLSPDEQEIGVAVLDIGGGTADFAVYQHNSIRHTMVLPVAGNHFTNDIAIGLRTTLFEAERIKKQYGTVWEDDIDLNQLIEVELVHGKDKQIFCVHDLLRILKPRAQEIFMLIHEEIQEKKLLPFIVTGIVLTGGGSLLYGMRELSEEIFKMPVRIGKPHIEFELPSSLYSPIYATGYGLLIHALKKQHNKTMQTIEGPVVKRIFERMKSWVLDLF